MKQNAFQIMMADNVATALTDILPGKVQLLGDYVESSILAVTHIPTGHKIALLDIAPGDPIFKYGVIIARAVKPIQKGEWVHLHNIHSVYDERSSHLDVITGAPTDILYE